MEVFDYNIKFNSWGEIYVGLKKGWITIEMLVEFCTGNNVIPCDVSRFELLCREANKTDSNIYCLLNKFISEDEHGAINDAYDKKFEWPYKGIPENYWDIWKLEIILRIIKENYSEEEKLNRIYYQILEDFGYFDDDLRKFSIINGPVVGIKGLYHYMSSYVNERIKYYQALNK